MFVDLRGDVKLGSEYHCTQDSVVLSKYHLLYEMLETADESVYWNMFQESIYKMVKYKANWVCEVGGDRVTRK